MNESLRTSKAGLGLIKSFEGLFLTAYRCPAGVLTIGYGHTSAEAPTVYPGMKITEQQADEILINDLTLVYEPAVRKLVKVPLTQNQFDVLVSFAFNCGVEALKKSTLLRKLNAGDYAAVPAELMRWTKANGKELKGLVRRRRAEAAMWRDLDGHTQLDLLPEPFQQQIDKPAPTAPTSFDKLIEKTSVAVPFVTALSATADWRVAAVVASAGVLALLALIVINRGRD